MSSIKQQLLSGVFYTALAKYSGIIVSLVVAGVLARLISPDDFGIMAVATVIIAFFNLFTDVGLSPAIIQHKDLTTENLSDLFSFTIWTGIGLSLLFAAASWPIAAYYDRDILRILCQLLAINLFFASATIVPNALFYRNKEFKFSPTELRHSIDCRSSGGDCRPLRSRTLRTCHRPYPVRYTDLYHFDPPLSTTSQTHIGTKRAATDFLLFRLPVPLQHHLLLQP